MEPQSLEDFLIWEADLPEPILGRGLLYQGTKAIFYGKYKSMKSMLVQGLGVNIARGEPWLKFKTPVEGASVLYLQLEIPHALLQRRLRKISGGTGWTKQPLMLWTEHSLKLDTAKGKNMLEYQLDRIRPKVLIVDPIYKVVSGNISDNSSMTPVVDYIDELIGKYGMSVILVNHTVKPPNEASIKEKWGSDDMIGGGVFSWWADTIIKVTRGDESLRINFDVVRHAEEVFDPVIVKIDDSLRLIEKPLI